MTETAGDAPIRILMLEDSALDAELIQAQLSRARMAFVIQRVWTREAFLAELDGDRHDVILADHVLPGFDGDTAWRQFTDPRAAAMAEPLAVALHGVSLSLAADAPPDAMPSALPTTLLTAPPVTVTASTSGGGYRAGVGAVSGWAASGSSPIWAVISAAQRAIVGASNRTEIGKSTR